MKQEIQKEQKKPTLPEIMEKYNCVFSLEIDSGFAHLKFVAGEMVVTLLNEEGYSQEEIVDVPFKSIETVANFMREMKELKLPEYKK